MRSLWRIIAARWLGGAASEALTGDTALLDLLMQGDGGSPPSFLVRRLPGVSHRAMMTQHDQAGPDLETTSGTAAADDSDG